MNNPVKKILMVGTALLVLGGCAGGFNKTTVTPNSVAENYPIMVDQQTVTLTIAVDRSLSDVSVMDKARLRAFVDSYVAQGHGPVTVTAPSGNPNDFFGQELATDIRQELHTLGVPWDAMLGATYRISSTAEAQEVIVSYSRYVATASPCGAFDEVWARNRKNLTSKNFGCATQANFAAMIADPRDLVEPSAVAAPDTVRRVEGITLFQQGAATASAEESYENTAASD